MTKLMSCSTTTIVIPVVGLLLDVDDPRAAAAAVGRGADIDERRDGQVTARGPGRRVEPVVARAARPPVRKGRDVGGEIQLGAVGLAAAARGPGAEPGGAPSHMAHQRRLVDHHLLDPRPGAGGGDARADDGAPVPIGAEPVVPFRMRDARAGRTGALAPVPGVLSGRDTVVDGGGVRQLRKLAVTVDRERDEDQRAQERADEEEVARRALRHCRPGPGGAAGGRRAVGAAAVMDPAGRPAGLARRSARSSPRRASRASPRARRRPATRRQARDGGRSSAVSLDSRR